MGQSLSLALFEAATSGEAEKIRLLLNQGADVHSKDADNGWTPLHFAVWAGKAAAVRELLVGGADVNARDNDLKSPLHYAVLGGHAGIMQSLCDHGAAVNASDADGQTALHKSAIQGQLSFLQELIARGADVNARLQDGSTAIHLASWKGHSSVLEYLLQSGANVDAVGVNGETGLHEAARAGQEACCRILTKRGANTSALNAEGQTPADVALQNNHQSTAALINHDPSAVERERHRKELQRRLDDPSAQPSAPTYDRVTYPVIDPPQPMASQGPAFSATQTATPAQERKSRRYGLPEGEDEDDWEPRQSDDWEGVEPPQNVESQGGRLMGLAENGSNQAGGGDAFWMIPGPIKWAAGNIGGVLNNVNPFRSPRRTDDAEPQPTPPSQQALETELESKEAEVSVLKKSEKQQELTDAQLKRIAEQEAQIAALKQELSSMRQGESSAGPSSGTAPEATSAKSRHHIIDLPPEPKPKSRLVDMSQLHMATNGFSNKLHGSQDGTFYRGSLDGADVAVWVPTQRGYHVQTAVNEAAQKLAGLSASLFKEQLVQMKAHTDDGCAVYELLQSGSVEDSLRSRAQAPGSAPVRLAWPARLQIVLHAAQGLQGLRTAGLQHSPAALKPSKVLLDSDNNAKLLPPSIASLLAGPQESSSQLPYIAPEVREGQPQTSRSDVFSLGVFMLQLITGSEASGLIQYADTAVTSGKLASILDPCAEGISAANTLPLAKLALRCTAFHPEERPDLAHEVLPALHHLSAASEASPQARAEEPPEHLICPITTEVMENPVILSDGYTYEEHAIRQWLSTGKQVSPMTNQRLESLTLTPNYVIKSAASTWRQQHPEPAASAAPKPAISVPAKSSATEQSNFPSERVQREAQEINQLLSRNHEGEVSESSVITDSDLPSAPSHAYFEASSSQYEPVRQYAS